ncbi:hypothetical protein [Rhodococcus sp. NPDC058521]|uniref:hypothetical protein n=1 Tax=Rhodococcus sp. NPDC058521 TaxID=3346536 RepID=UPI00364ABC86
MAELELDRGALSRCIDACSKLVEDMDALLVRARSELAPANMGLGEEHLPSAAAFTNLVREKASAAMVIIEANRDRAVEMRADFERTLAAYDEQDSAAAASIYGTSLSDAASRINSLG